MNDVFATLQQIRDQTPLVHCITNTVAANFAANAVIAVGGSPVMASEPTEVASITKLSQALTINIGTCTPNLVTAIKNAVQEANKLNINWVLDPVGVAATEIRQSICADLIENYRPAVIRGNASEIMALAICTNVFSGAAARTRGLDSVMTAESVIPAAKALACRFRLVVAVSGERDFVLDGRNCGRLARIANGHARMAEVTATGCALTAVLGAFLATDLGKQDVFTAVCQALSFYAVCGEYAARESRGTGSMHVNLLDQLRSLNFSSYQALARPIVDLSLYLVTDPQLNGGRPVEEVVKRAIMGGATLVQLREKHCDSGEFLNRARKVKAVCDEFGVLLLINDRVDIALAVDAAGVHIGQSDLPVEVARRLLGPNKIIGLSVSTREEILKAKAYKNEIDYIGLGPLYPTTTKTDAKTALGLDLAAQNLELVDHLACGIGGINESNAAEVYRIPRLNGIAVVTAISMAECPQTAAQRLLALRSSEC